jgi:hypothetical protein
MVAIAERKKAFPAVTSQCSLSTASIKLPSEPLSPSCQSFGGTAFTVAPNCRSTQYRTRFEEPIQAKYAEFASNARLLEAVEWGKRLMRRTIDNDASGLQLSRHPFRMIYVGREHVGLQPIAAVIGNLDSFGLAPIGDDTEHRP